jgi:xanthine dehydrogenase YagR molybdenum-binding subunit
MFGFGKDDTHSLTMNQPHPDSLLDTGVQGVISKPLDRVDGPKKVTGTATYAAEYAIENIAHGVLVSATKGHAKIKAIDADAVKAIPGVIDVIDYDSFIRKGAAGRRDRGPDARGAHHRLFRRDHRDRRRRELRGRARRRQAAEGRV